MPLANSTETAEAAETAASIDLIFLQHYGGAVAMVRTIRPSGILWGLGVLGSNPTVHLLTVSRLKDSDMIPSIEARDLIMKPIEEAETIPAQWYHGETFAAFDQQHVLGGNWQYFCHESALQEPGSYFCGDVAGAGLAAVRDQDGEIRVFHNVCRHRGGPLMRGQGSGRMIRCRYHGWSYTLDGRLAGTPRFDGAKDFDRQTCSLFQVRCFSFAGLLFVDLSGSAPSGSLVFEGVDQRIEPIELAGFQFVHRDEYEVACNWKGYVDNYMEGYHIGIVHPELAQILDTSGYRSEVKNLQVLQSGPIAQGDNPYGSGSGTAFYYFIYPNIMLNILPGRMQVNSVVPLAHNRCKVIFDYCYAGSLEGADKRLSEDRAFSDIVQRQDIDICEAVQRNLEAGIYTKGRLSVSEELGVHQFHNLLRQSYRNGLMKTRLFHLIRLGEWEVVKQQSSYRPPSVEAEGFIHCSTAVQLLATANRYYAKCPDLLVLEIDPTLVIPPVRLDLVRGNEHFPHIYGSLNLDAVVNVHELRASASGMFDELPSLE